MDNTGQGAEGYKYYVCGIYKRKKNECTAHYIRVVVQENLVVENLQKVIAYVQNYKDDFVRQVMANEMEESAREQAHSKRQLEQQTRRIAEIDNIIKRLYEDSVTGKLSDERFTKMSADYEMEQRTLESNTAELRKTVDACEAQGVNIKRVLKIVHSYIEPEELTPAILHKFVEKSLSMHQINLAATAPNKSTFITILSVKSHYPVK